MNKLNFALLLYISFSMIVSANDNSTDETLRSIFAQLVKIENIDEEVIPLQVEHTQLIDPRYNKFSSTYHHSLKDKLNKILREKKLTPDQEHYVFIILNKLFFYTQDDVVLQSIASLVNSLSPNNPNQKKYATTLRDNYIAKWRMNESKLIANTYNLSPLLSEVSWEDFNKIDSPTTKLKMPKLTVELSANALQIKDFSHLSSKSHIVIIGSPFCSHSQRFSQWLNNNEEIKNAVGNNAIWIMKQTGNIRFEEVLEYNSNPKNPLYRYVYRREAWDSIKYWGTPALYFYNEKGMLIRQLVGWPKEGKKDELIEAMTSINLL